MNINVSEKVKSELENLAMRNGKSVEDFAGDLLEKKLSETIQNQPSKKKLSDLAGMFYGGDGKTAENASEILRLEVDKISGFGK